MKFVNGIPVKDRTTVNGFWDYTAFRTQSDFPVFGMRCPQCATLIEYDLDGIDGHRAWFPEGFIYCPRCGRPCRHNIKNQINGYGFSTTWQNRFCTHCGTPVAVDAQFCSHCGEKLR